MPDTAVPTPDLSRRASHMMFEPVTLRYSDEDSNGHINNVAYAAYFEAGRLGLFMKIFEGFDDVKFNFVLASLKIDYLAEMHFPGMLEVGGRVLKVGTSSITTGYGAFLGDVCHAVSTCVNVYIDPKTRRARPFPDPIRAALLKSAEAP